MIVAGGIVVCKGGGCFVSFSDVSFRNATVVVTGGAGARFTGCDFDLCGTSHETSMGRSRIDGVGVLAHGAGSKVVMECCTVAGGAQVRPQTQEYSCFVQPPVPPPLPNNIQCGKGDACDSCGSNYIGQLQAYSAGHLASSGKAVSTSV